MENKVIHATYVGDSKHHHLFHIDGNQGFMGTVYAPRNRPVPDVLSIRMRTKTDAEAEEESYSPATKKGF